MDIKDLNKPQLILLAILLSFVISIATGITTVTLMEQAPNSVTVPINRIIRQTVEKIVPGSTTTNNQTVIIKEEDLVVDSIAKNKSSLYSITKESPEGEVLAGKGFIISSDGTIAVDGLFVPNDGTYYVKNDNGKFKASFISRDVAGFSLLKIGDPIGETSKLNIVVPVFGDISKMKTGQKVLVLGNTISSFIFEGAENIKANFSKPNVGAVVLDLDGEVLGMVTSSEENSFVPIDTILKAILPKTN